ncbi:MAG: type II toxin-antitoxin system HicA family toxin, partial [Methanobacteriota archaeon]
MGRLPVLSGRDAVKAFSRAGWRPVRQHGSHVIYRIDLATAAVERRIPLAPPVSGVDIPVMASDGERIFVARDGGVDAWTPDGEVAWSWEPGPLVEAPRIGWACADPAVSAGVLFVACTEVGGEEGRPTDAVSFIAALDGPAGVLRWRFAREPTSKLNHPGLPAP